MEVMRNTSFAMCLWLAASIAQAQSSGEWRETNTRWEETGAQAAVGLGWRFDNRETGTTALAHVGLLLWPTSFSAFQARLTYHPKNNAYLMSQATVWSFSLGLRLQPRHARFCGFVGFELDESWYTGRSRVYSAETGAVVGHVTLTDFKPGVAFSGGLAFRLNKEVAMDFGIRKVLNTIPHSVHEMTMPPLNGEQRFSFPSRLFNQATLFLQTRVTI